MTNMKQGNLVALPGLPAFYDYEWYPQPDEMREAPLARYNEHGVQPDGLPINFYDIFKTGAE